MHGFVGVLLVVPGFWLFGLVGFERGFHVFKLISNSGSSCFLKCQEMCHQACSYVTVDGTQGFRQASKARLLYPLSDVPSLPFFSFMTQFLSVALDGLKLSLS